MQPRRKHESFTMNIMEKNKRLSKAQRQEVLAALIRTLADNFKILSEKQIRGIAIHFLKHMAPLIAKTKVYVETDSFSTEEMKNAFAEVLAKRILHIESLAEEPQLENEE